MLFTNRFCKVLRDNVSDKNVFIISPTVPIKFEFAQRNLSQHLYRAISGRKSGNTEAPHYEVSHKEH